MLAFISLALAFILALILKDTTPFNVTAPVAVGGKWLENVRERGRHRTEEGE